MTRICFFNSATVGQGIPALRILQQSLEIKVNRRFTQRRRWQQWERQNYDFGRLTTVRYIIHSWFQKTWTNNGEVFYSLYVLGSETRFSKVPITFGVGANFKSRNKRKKEIQSTSSLRSFRQRVVSLRVRSFRSRVRSFRLRVVIRLLDFYFR